MRVRVCGAGLCERNGAAEQGVRWSVKHTGSHRAGSLHVTRSETIVPLPASLWLLSPTPWALLCLLPCLPSIGLCNRLCLLASPVPTRCPLWSRGASSQERGPLVCRDQLIHSPKCISSRVSALVPVTCFLMCWGPGMVLSPPRICCDSMGNTFFFVPSPVPP